MGACITTLALVTGLESEKNRASYSVVDSASKKITEKRETRIWCDFPPFCGGSESTVDRYDFKLRRISIKAGIQL